MKILVSLSFAACMYLVLLFPLVFTFARLVGQEWKCSTKDKVVAYVIVFAAIFASIVYSIDDKKVVIFEIILCAMNVLDILLQKLISRSIDEAKNEE